MMITSMKCQKCGRIFVYTFHTRKCVCGWEPSQDAQKGIEEVGKNKNKRKNKRKGSKEMVNVPVTYAGAGTRADSWEVEIDKVHECSKVPKDIKVLIDLFARRKITALMKKYPSIEWLAYLLGDKENPYIVKDIFIPNQEVTATSVDKIVCEEFNDLPIIGVIHSHHGMGNGFSGTDHEWINQNHNISLCISKTGIAGQVRVTTPCGALKIISNVTVKVKYPEIEFDFDKWIDDETKKIATKTYQSTYTYGQGWDGRNWNGKNNSWHQGQPGRWVNGVFFPDSCSPSQKGGQSQPLTESQKSYTTGVAVVPPKTDETTPTPTIDEEMSLAEALSRLGGEQNESIDMVEPVSVETEIEENKDDTWNTD